MLFENLTDGIPDVPSFRAFRIRDINPLSGSSKSRIIYDPNEPMRIIHARLIAYLRQLDVELPSATGARPQWSCVKNVLRHRKSRHIYIVDIQHAYHSVDGEKLASILCEVDKRLTGKQVYVLDFLRRYCLATESGGLVIGAPASPDLFNLYAEVMIDRPLRTLAERYGFIYTRYLDDLTFSSRYHRIGERKRRAIRNVVARAGLTIHHRKSKLFDLRKGPVVINGIGLRWGGKLFMPRSYLRKINGLLHRAQNGDEVSTHRVMGMMGLFWSTWKFAERNRAEQKLVEQFERYRLLPEGMRT